MHLVNVDRKLEHRGGHISKLVQRESCLQQLGCCIHFPIGLWKITWTVNWQLLQSSCATVLIHLPQSDIISVHIYILYRQVFITAKPSTWSNIGICFGITFNMKHSAKNTPKNKQNNSYQCNKKNSDAAHCRQFNSNYYFSKI